VRHSFQALAPLLLADPSPSLRLLVLRELLGRPEDDPEVRELVALREEEALVADLLELQEPDGSWQMVGPASRGGRLRATALALLRLGYLGLDRDHPAVERGAEFLFSLQHADGSWPLTEAWSGTLDGLPLEGREGYSMIPLQTALPLQSLAACGYGTDPRAERAFDWLLAQRLADGAWPTGIAAGNYGRVGGYRRLAHSRWGCRSNTTAALIALAFHPERRSSGEARRALDLLLGRETREAHALGFEVARLIGAEPARGFLTYYARFDLALVLDLCWRVGASAEDERITGMLAFVQGVRGPYGLWEYAPRPQVSRWVTFDLLRSLSRLAEDTDAAGDWLSLEPRTPFRAYAKKLRRY
jgi:hypothetical protein